MWKNKRKEIVFMVLVIFLVGMICPASAMAAGDDRIIVSMGDSYSSGEGLGSYGDKTSLEDKVSDRDWLAHRSNNAWGGQLYLPVSDGQKIEMSKNRDTHWYFVAASGAETIHCSAIEEYYDKTKDGAEHLKSEQEKTYNNSIGKNTKYLPPQLYIFDKLEKEGKKANYVTITIGGNDLKFETIARDVLSPESYLDFNKFEKDMEDAYAKIQDGGETYKNLENVYNDIADRSNGAKIIVAGYPKLFDGETTKNEIVARGLLSAIFVYRAERVNKAVGDFNNVIKNITEKCKNNGKEVYFVSVEEEFNGHGAGSSDPYITYFSLVNSDDLDSKNPVSSKTMHPNSKGAEAYRKCVQAKIDELELNNNIIGGAETIKQQSVSMEQAYEGVQNYLYQNCPEIMDKIENDVDGGYLIHDVGDSFGKDYVMVLRTYTGSYSYFHVDIATGDVKVYDYDPAISEEDILNENISFNVKDYLD